MTDRKNLSRAGWLLIAEFVGIFVLAYAFIRAGLSTDYLFPVILLFNLLPAWFIAKAARDHGKSPVLYGLPSALFPALALFAWTRLNSAHLWQSLEHKYGRTDDEA